MVRRCEGNSRRCRVDAKGLRFKTLFTLLQFNLSASCFSLDGSCLLVVPVHLRFWLVQNCAGRRAAPFV